MISSLRLSWRPVTIGVPQGLILRPALFNIFFSDPCNRTDCSVGKLDVMQNWEEWWLNQMDMLLLRAEKMDRLKKWANRNCVKFHKEKSKA